MKLTAMTGAITKRVLIYGGPKSGKTLLAGKLAEHYNLIYIGLENGHTVFSQLPIPWQERIDVVAIPDSRVLPMGIETALKIIKGTECKVCDTHGKVSCALCAKQGASFTRVCLNELGPRDIVIFDSLTQLTNSAISHITKDQDDTYKLDFSDWGQLSVLIDKFLSQVQAARFNVICITHESEVEMEDGKSKLVPVSGSSKSSRNTAKYFDDVVYVEVRNKKHVAGSATNYSNSAVTGSRSGVALENSGEKGASLLDMFTSWKGGWNSESNKVKEQEIKIIPAIESKKEEIKPEIAGGNKSVESLESIVTAAEKSFSNTEVEEKVPVLSATPATLPAPAAEMTPGQKALANLMAKRATGK